MKRLLHPAILSSLLAVTACAARGPAPAGAGAAAAGASDADHHHVEPLPATAGPGYTVADVRFMQDMIGHHAQALTMSAMAPSHGASEHVLKLVEKIDISQRDEIGMMKQWLAERNQAVPDEQRAHALHMPGMLTPAQLAQLDAARGREFDRLFLTFMIRHHEGALTMVDALFASPGAGQDPDIFRFATDVAADQLDEIEQMKYVLYSLEANRESELR